MTSKVCLAAGRCFASNPRRDKPTHPGWNTRPAVDVDISPAWRDTWHLGEEDRSPGIVSGSYVETRVEKPLRWRRAATYGTALVLLAFGALVVAAPDALPALTVPGTTPQCRDGPHGVLTDRLRPFCAQAAQGSAVSTNRDPTTQDA
jgi:hypothetical protein